MNEWKKHEAFFGNVRHLLWQFITQYIVKTYIHDFLFSALQRSFSFSLSIAILFAFEKLFLTFTE